MIYLNLPIGGAHGWGVCGKYIAREMARMTETRLLTENTPPELIGDELEWYELTRLFPSPAEVERLVKSGAPLDGPLLQLANKQLQPMHAAVKGNFTLGYAFFEDTELKPQHLENAKHFDRLSTGSTWCSEILRRHGLENVETVVQGVDQSLFFPRESRDFVRDKFVVFSGGKFEFRKGHDLVIRAFKALQDRHKDVMLVASWFNQWEFSFRTMKQSPHIRFESTDLARVLADNGIDLQRVILLGPRAHHALGHVYHNTDVGIFPNRAEGGTNLVLMEYMACGKPVIATASTGHADVVNDRVARVIGTRGEVTSSSDGESVARWPEPVLEEVIEQLEWAYQNRDELRQLSAAAGEAMKQLTWRRMAEQFLSLLRKS